MAFSEALKAKVRKRAHHACCLCKTIGVDVHHILPREENGPDTEDNAAPLCPTCHGIYGANPQKRKIIREARDLWYEICEKRYAGDETLIRQALSEHMQPVTESLDEIKATLASMSPKQEPKPGDTEAQKLAKEVFNKGNDAYKSGDTSAARAYYGSAVRLDPGSAWAFNNLGNAKHALGDYAGAILDHTEAIRLDPKLARAFNNRGNAKHALGDYAGAIADHTEAIRLDPNDAPTFNNRGNARYELGDIAGAILDHTEAIRLDPKLARAFNNRGNAKHALGDYAGAIADHTEAIRLDPDFPPPPDAQ